VYVTGEDAAVAPYTGFSYGTVAYDAATGSQLWSATYGSHEAAFGIAVSPDGSTVFVTGEGDSGFVTVAYNAATGAQLWSRVDQGIAGPVGAIAVSPRGSAVFVTGQYNSTTSYGYATVSYNGLTGKTRWTRIYRPAVGAGGTTATAIAVNPAGTRVFVTGTDTSTSASRWYATVAYNAATGARLWVRRDASRGYLPAPVVALSRTGATVYLAYSYNDAYYAVEAVSAATGARRWRSIDTRLAEGSPDSIAVGPAAASPSVFVTGTSLFGTSSLTGPSFQYATVAYRG
jgi:DNA-binding beta-propeller fold protein YncE